MTPEIMLKSPRFPRFIIFSMQQLSLATRSGHNTIGTPVQLVSNYYQFRLRNENQTFVKYSFEINPPISDNEYMKIRKVIQNRQVRETIEQSCLFVAF